MNIKEELESRLKELQDRSNQITIQLISESPAAQNLQGQVTSLKKLLKWIEDGGPESSNGQMGVSTEVLNEEVLAEEKA